MWLDPERISLKLFILFCFFRSYYLTYIFLPSLPYSSCPSSLPFLFLSSPDSDSSNPILNYQNKQALRSWCIKPPTLTPQSMVPPTPTPQCMANPTPQYIVPSTDSSMYGSTDSSLYGTMDSDSSIIFLTRAEELVHKTTPQFMVPPPPTP